MVAVFAAIVEFSERLGIRDLIRREGCWEVQVDRRWWFAVNPRREALKCSHGTTVPPVGVYVEYNGWPAGVFTPVGGQFAAGDGANEDAFMAALRDHVVVGARP